MSKFILYGLLWPTFVVLWVVGTASVLAATAVAVPCVGLMYLYATVYEKICQLSGAPRRVSPVTTIRLGVNWEAYDIDYDKELKAFNEERKKTAVGPDQGDELDAMLAAVRTASADRTPLTTERYSGADPAAGPDHTVTAVQTADGWRATTDSVPVAGEQRVAPVCLTAHADRVIQAGVQGRQHAFMQTPFGVLSVTVAELRPGHQFRLGDEEWEALADGGAGWWRCVRGLYASNGREFIDCQWLPLETLVADVLKRELTRMRSATVHIDGRHVPLKEAT